MQLLPETFRKNGMDYALISRNDKVAMYEQFSPEGISVGFEVILVRIQKAMDVVLNGVTIHYVEKEALPSNEMFGTKAWAFIHRDFAQEKYDEVTNSIVTVTECDDIIDDNVDSDETVTANITLNISPFNGIKITSKGRGRKPIPVTYNGITYRSKGEAISSLIQLNLSNDVISKATGSSLASILCGRSMAKKLCIQS